MLAVAIAGVFALVFVGGSVHADKAGKTYKEATSIEQKVKGPGVQQMNPNSEARKNVGNK